VDDSLPFIANIFLANAIGFCAAIILVLVSQPVLVIPLVVLGFLYFQIQRFYRCGAYLPHEEDCKLALANKKLCCNIVLLLLDHQGRKLSAVVMTY
jgi:hypothetical protein